MSDTSQPTPPAPTVDTGTVRELAPGVWAIPDHRVPLVPNIGIVVGDHTALVVDCGMGPANGRNVLALARKLAGDRRLILTISHFHPEHGFGAQAFKGEATILYNAAQADELAAKGEAYLGMFRGFGQTIADALDGTTLVAADQTYAGASHSLDLGGRTVELRTWGQAHTRGDQIVWLPGERILFTGDLAEEKTFPIFPWFPPEDADIDGANWVKVLEACEALQPRIVVPGHGEIGGAEILVAVRRYMLDLAAQVRSRRAAGADVDAIVAELAPQVRAAHPDWHFPEWIDFAIRYYASLA